jgi:hypothetical protein
MKFRSWRGLIVKPGVLTPGYKTPNNRHPEGVQGMKESNGKQTHNNNPKGKFTGYGYCALFKIVFFLYIILLK